MAAMLRLHWMDTRYSFTVFWLTLLGTGIVFFLLVWLTDSQVMLSGWFAVYIFAFVNGVMTVHCTFPVAVGWSLPRRDYYLATVVHYVTVALALSVLYMLMYEIERIFLSGLTGERFQFFTMPFLTEAKFWLLLWMHFIWSLTFMTAGHFFGCLHYRYGVLGVVSFIVIGAASMALINLFGAWGWLKWLVGKIASFEELTLWLLPANAAVLAVAWLFLRKAPSRKMG